MQRLAILIALLGLTGCGALPAVQIHSAPTVPAVEAERLNTHRTRIMAIDAERVFPRVLEVLMDQGFVILCADASLGTVAFRQQWRDPGQRGASIVQEGNLLVSAQGPGQTRIRLLLTGSSQELRHWYGKDGGHKTMVGSVQQDLGQEEYSKLLDVLEKGLATLPVRGQG